MDSNNSNNDDAKTKSQRTKDAERELTNRERNFVENYVRNTTTAADAVRASYNMSTDKAVYSMANKLLKKPVVRAAIDAAFADEWPDSELDTIVRLRNIVHQGKDGDAISAIKELAKIRGYYKTQKSARVNMNLDGSKFGMPDTDGED